ncbi:heterokaryon incompatibility protein-domain-containing protein [Plectosphaerella cucumerina]|uniref:Heterokaryon incompatibility protein-domain-containing protein n=1 Tax=Plectosphaerella cucumerina TaxID=40658 RepID=A0A8K0T697_9PEZI|nr:heterokaryon incompatibility protein-domain-containing protein [Plectosphaerella cucumerina]
MRCLNTTTFEIREADQAWFKHHGYAILSHRWQQSEVLFDQATRCANDLRRTTGRHANAGMDKILGACITARQLSIEWMWIDSCCINKTYSAELLEALNSMFNWYKDAVVCITFLGDVISRGPTSASPDSPAVFHDERTGKPSVWFTRGWTLQELLAPTKMYFYDANWRFFGSRTQLAVALARITGIARPYLTGERHFRDACIATKMSWMAGRTTTREEDMAYSMAGIFNVSLDAQYGEGRNAFMRLQRALLAKNDESLFAWKMPVAGLPGDHDHRVPIPSVGLGPREWGLLAASPAWFADCGRMTSRGGRGIIRPEGGLGLTPQGISGYIARRDALVTKMFSSRTKSASTNLALNCWEEDAAGNLKAVQVALRPVSRNPAIFVRTECQAYDLVDGIKSTSASAFGTVMQPELY